MKKKYFTICIHFYNRGPLISSTLKSIISNFKSNEVNIILIDDNSSDNGSYVSRKILRDYNYKFIYLKNRINMGTNFCKNLAIKIFKTKWLIFLDSDDKMIINYQKIYQILKFYENYKLVCFSSKSNTRGNLNSNRKNKIISYHNFVNCGKGSEVLDCMQKIKCVDPFEKKIKLGNEIVGWSRIFKEIKKCILLPKIGRLYNENYDQRISNKSKIKMSKFHLLGYFFFFKENFNNLKTLTKIKTLIKIIIYCFLSLFDFIFNKIIKNNKINYKH